MMSGMLPSGTGMQAGQGGQQIFRQAWPMQGLDDAMNGAALDATSQDDNWSTSSRSGPTAPTTLNVEDWYVQLFESLFSYNLVKCFSNHNLIGFNSLVSMGASVT